ncbi:MAG: sigma-70 family RNA polymerase sigma factor [Verrucomicrobiota bacterium JB023]|nr:sigma-70 family RNA polymerase sigma factor [Verrucomicrobiota bacterium JB023]
MITTYETRYSLLQRATDPADNAAWEELVCQYRRFIYCVLNQVGIPERDVDDLTQQILITLARYLPRYDRERAGFRTWLSKMIRNKANTYLRKKYAANRCLDRMVDESNRRGLIEVPEIEQIIEREWAAYVAGLAMERVREAFQGQAVEVFELGLDGLPAAAIAERTGLSIATVYTLKKRVKRRLYQEIRQLSAELER